MRFAMMRRDTQHAASTASHLSSVGFGTDHFELFSDVTAAMAANSYDLVLTETHLPDGSAAEWLRSRTVARRVDTTFVIVLADRETERVEALEAGADDSVSSVVSGRELVARIRALLRRPRTRAANVIKFGNLGICLDSRAVSVGGRQLAIQRRETAILEALLRRAGSVLARAALEHDIYGLNTDCAPNSLEVRISRLRRHLEKADATLAIETVRGVGYRVVERGSGATRIGVASTANLHSRKMLSTKQLAHATA